MWLRTNYPNFQITKMNEPNLEIDFQTNLIQIQYLIFI